VCLDSFSAAVSAFLCLACSSSAEHCYCFIKCFFEQINKQTNKQTIRPTGKVDINAIGPSAHDETEHWSKRSHAEQHACDRTAYIQFSKIKLNAVKERFNCGDWVAETGAQSSEGLRGLQITCVCLDSFSAAVSASLCLACSSSAEHCCCFIERFFEQINKQTNKQIYTTD